MDILQDSAPVIEVKAQSQEVVKMFLRIFLAQERLPDGQLDITAALVSKYAEYRNSGVIEPYASSLLFSTETRKEIYKDLDISAAQFNNAFKPLMEKNILAKEDDKYFLNPSILPSKTLTFNFVIEHAK